MLDLGQITGTALAAEIAEYFDFLLGCHTRHDPGAPLPYWRLAFTEPGDWNDLFIRLMILAGHHADRATVLRDLLGIWDEHGNYARQMKWYDEHPECPAGERDQFAALRHAHEAATRAQIAAL